MSTCALSACANKVALLSGFGGANTAKEGEKALDQETPEEKAKRVAESTAQMAAKMAVCQMHGL